MSPVTQTNRISWFGRIKQSLGGIIFGFFFIIGAFVLLWYNEGRAVKTAKGLKEGKGQVVTITPDSVDRKFDNRLIHFSGMATSFDTLRDNLLGVEIPGLVIKRNVEMYQWVEKSESETKDKIGGAQETTTTYRYEKQWNGSLVSSSNFKEAGHDNPTIMPVEGMMYEAQPITIGAYTINRGMAGGFNDYSSLPLGTINDTAIIEVKKMLKGTVDNPYNFSSQLRHQKTEKHLFVGRGTAASPDIGDIRISYSYVPFGVYTVVCRQENGQLMAHTTSKGTYIQMLRKGSFSAEEMFDKALKENSVLTWILRVVGFLVMFMAISLILRPISVLGSVIPILGRILNFGTGLFAGIIAAFLSLLTIGIAWVFYRPILGISLVAIAIGLVVYFGRKGKKKELERDLNVNYVKE